MRAIPVSFTLRDNCVPDVVPLTSWEKLRKEELEAVVAGGLAKFLEVGMALAELRNRGLYRTEHATFESYVHQRFGLHRSSVDGVIRSAQTAAVLVDGGLRLPSDTNPTSLRAISALPGDDSLKTACWQLAERLSPAHTPSQPLVSKLCRMVRNLVEGEGDSALKAPGRHHRSTAPLERETPFVRPLLRLSAWSGFNPEVVTSHIAESANARTLFSACTEMITRCRQVQQRLRTRFPDMEDSLVEHNQR
jgi:hypothetical protein